MNFYTKKSVQEMTTTERDKVWKGYTRECIEYLKQGKYASYRTTRLCMADFRKNEGAYRDSISLLTEVLMWDNIGCTHDQFENASWYFAICSPLTFPKEGKNYLVVPAVARLLELCKKYLKWTDDELKAFMFKEAERVSLPYMPYTNTESVELYFLFKNKDYAGIEKIVRRAKRRTKQTYPNEKF